MRPTTAALSRRPAPSRCPRRRRSWRRSSPRPTSRRPPPCANSISRRNDVQVGDAPGAAVALRGADLGGLPARDLVAVVDDARAGAKARELRLQLLEVVRQQEKR